jgi:protein-tyrosine phosphatase
MDLLPNVPNFRDLGGMAAEDGSILKMHKLYRSAALHAAGARERARLINEFDLGTVIDLRTALERAGAPDPNMPHVQSLHAPLIPMKTLGLTFEDGNLAEMIRGAWDPDTFDVCSVYRDMVDGAVSEEWQSIFRMLLESNGHAVLWHCTNGKDRTGVVAAVILLALGVPYDTVMADYLFTNRELEAHRKAIEAKAALNGGKPEFIDRIGALLEARPEYLNAALDAIDEKHGGLNGFLEDVCGIGYAEDEILRDSFLQ